MDRGYNDYDWFSRLSRQGVSFVTRLNDGAAYTDVPEKARSAAGDKILSGRVITFDNQKLDENGKRPEFRIVKVWIGGKHGLFTYFEIEGKYIEK